jgi:hypothetical protein
VLVRLHGLDDSICVHCCRRWRLLLGHNSLGGSCLVWWGAGQSCGSFHLLSAFHDAPLQEVGTMVIAMTVGATQVWACLFHQVGVKLAPFAVLFVLFFSSCLSTEMALWFSVFFKMLLGLSMNAKLITAVCLLVSLSLAMIQSRSWVIWMPLRAGLTLIDSD